jgi:hypothetical protein
MVDEVSAGARYELSLEFEARGSRGTVEVSLWVNADPSVVGSGSEAEGFPACQATVASDLQGYASLFGWVQLVGTESPEEPMRHFEVDPLEISADLNWPFGFYGLLPTLFDTPSRRDRTQTLRLARPQLPVRFTRQPDGPGGSSGRRLSVGVLDARRPDRHRRSDQPGAAHMEQPSQSSRGGVSRLAL